MNTKRMLSRALSVGLFLVAGSATSFAAPPGNFGERIGEGNSVPVYSNGHPLYYSGLSSRDRDGRYFGIKWQCVEFARRYTFFKRGYLIPSHAVYTKSAATIWYYAGKLGLSKANNGSTNRPRKNDLVFSVSGANGHVGVITSAPSSISAPGTYHITITHQNWSTTNPKITRHLTVTKGSDGSLRYRLEGFSSTYPVVGWAWR